MALAIQTVISLLKHVRNKRSMAAAQCNTTQQAKELLDMVPSSPKPDKEPLPSKIPKAKHPVHVTEIKKSITAPIKHPPQSPCPNKRKIVRRRVSPADSVSESRFDRFDKYAAIDSAFRKAQYDKIIEHSDAKSSSIRGNKVRPRPKSTGDSLLEFVSEPVDSGTKTRHSCSSVPSSPKRTLGSVTLSIRPLKRQQSNNYNQSNNVSSKNTVRKRSDSTSVSAVNLHTVEQNKHDMLNKNTVRKHSCCSSLSDANLRMPEQSPHRCQTPTRTINRKKKRLSSLGASIDSGCQKNNTLPDRRGSLPLAVGSTVSQAITKSCASRKTSIPLPKSPRDSKPSINLHGINSDRSCQVKDSKSVSVERISNNRTARQWVDLTQNGNSTKQRVKKVEKPIGDQVHSRQSNNNLLKRQCSERHPPVGRVEERRGSPGSQRRNSVGNAEANNIKIVTKTSKTENIKIRMGQEVNKCVETETSVSLIIDGEERTAEEPSVTPTEEKIYKTSLLNRVKQLAEEIETLTRLSSTEGQDEAVPHLSSENSNSSISSILRDHALENRAPVSRQSTTETGLDLEEDHDRVCCEKDSYNETEYLSISPTERTDGQVDQVLIFNTEEYVAVRLRPLNN